MLYCKFVNNKKSLTKICQGELLNMLARFARTWCHCCLQLIKNVTL